jgi:hypothetical protein
MTKGRLPFRYSRCVCAAVARLGGGHSEFSAEAENTRCHLFRGCNVDEPGTEQGRAKAQSVQDAKTVTFPPSADVWCSAVQEAEGVRSMTREGGSSREDEEHGSDRCSDPWRMLSLIVPAERPFLGHFPGRRLRLLSLPFSRASSRAEPFLACCSKKTKQAVA